MVFRISTCKEVAGLWPGATGVDQCSFDPLVLLQPPGAIHSVQCSVQCVQILYLYLFWWPFQTECCIFISFESHFRQLCHSPLDLLQPPGYIHSVQFAMRANTVFVFLLRAISNSCSIVHWISSIPRAISVLCSVQCVQILYLYFFWEPLQTAPP